MWNALVKLQWEHIVQLIASVAFFCLSILSLTQPRTSLSRALALVTGCLFAYVTLEVLGHLSPFRLEWLECFFADVAAVPALYLTAEFIGRRHYYRKFLFACGIYFGLIATLCLLAPVAQPLRTFPGGPWWAMLTLGGLAPSFGFFAWQLAVYLRAVDDEEKIRGYLFVVALFLGVGGVIFDLAEITGIPAPHLSAFGLLSSSLVLSLLVLRFDLLSGLKGLAVATSLGVSSFVVLAELLLFASSRGNPPAILVGTLVIILCASIGSLPFLRMFVKARTRAVYLETLGRMSAQLAHDVKNPLAAIRGAAQVLEMTVPKTAPEDDFVQLIIDQVDRTTKIIETYQKLGAATARRDPTDILLLIKRVVDQQTIIFPNVSFQTPDGSAFGSSLARCAVDETLVESALENLVKNAADAVATVAAPRVEVTPSIEASALRITVSDNGSGIDRRWLDQIGQDFVTNKATGTGLGLSFCERVAKAHQGRLIIQSSKQGTAATLLLRGCLT